MCGGPETVEGGRGCSAAVIEVDGDDESRTGGIAVLIGGVIFADGAETMTRSNRILAKLKLQKRTDIS